MMTTMTLNNEVNIVKYITINMKKGKCVSVIDNIDVHVTLHYRIHSRGNRVN